MANNTFRIAALQQELDTARQVEGNAASSDEPTASVEAAASVDVASETVREASEEILVEEESDDEAMPDVTADAVNTPLPEGDAADTIA